MPTLYQTIIIALIASFIILFLGKTGLRIKLRDACDKIKLLLIAEMLDCDFCLSFWTCFLLVILAYLFGYDISLITIICAPPITRYLL